MKARPDHQFNVIRLTAFEGFAVDATQEVDDELISVSRLRRLAALLFKGAVLLGDFLQLPVYLFVARIIDRARERQGRRVHRLEFRHQLDRQIEGEIGAAGEHALEIAREVDIRGSSRADLGVVDGLLLGFLQGLLDHFLHQTLAVHLAHMGRRDLARTEALELHLRLDLGDLRLKPFRQ